MLGGKGAELIRDVAPGGIRPSAVCSTVPDHGTSILVLHVQTAQQSDQGQIIEMQCQVCVQMLMSLALFRMREMNLDPSSSNPIFRVRCPVCSCYVASLSPVFVHQTFNKPPAFVHQRISTHPAALLMGVFTAVVSKSPHLSSACQACTVSAQFSL